MGGWWVQSVLSYGGPALLISWIVWVIVAITLHELGHGWAAIRLGDRTPIETGHMTWNPLVHMGMFSFLALALVGLAWGAMPVDGTRLRGRHAGALVAAAGPAVNIALAGLSAAGLALWVAIAYRAGVQEPLLTNMLVFFRIGVVLNIVLALFNLAPFVPLDGGNIALNYSDAYRRLMQSEHGRWVPIVGFILLFMVGGRVLLPAAIWVLDVIETLIVAPLSP